MSGKSPLLRFATGVITEASLLLPIEDEGSHLRRTCLGDIGAQVVAAEEIVEVGYTIDDDCPRVRAFPLCHSTQLITIKQIVYILCQILMKQALPLYRHSSLG